MYLSFRAHRTKRKRQNQKTADKLNILLITGIVTDEHDSLMNPMIRYMQESAGRFSHGSAAPERPNMTVMLCRGTEWAASGEVTIPFPDLQGENLRNIVLTPGAAGSVYIYGNEVIHQDIYKVETVDTTAAGDTFTGYFTASVIRGEPPKEALDLAAKAASITVSRHGAAPSIPTPEEIKLFMK